MNISFGDILFPLIRCSLFKLSNTTFLFPDKLDTELKSDIHPIFLV